MLKCLVCGKYFNNRLSPHIIAKHKMSSEEYRNIFGKDLIIFILKIIKYTIIHLIFIYQILIYI